MLVLDFLRYFRGYVQFTAQGDFVERFLNLVARDKIPIWEGRKRGDVYTGYTTAACYKRLRSHARKTGVRLRLQKKTGAPFQRKRYRRRLGLVFGLALFSAFLFVMSLFIWRIEVGGAETMSESSILHTLESIGVKPGVFRASIDVRDAERRALLAMPDLSWIALNMDGSVLRVEVSERVVPPDMVDPNQPCNLVASHAGQILSVYVYEGQAVVQAGDSVAAGDVLVSGITEDRLGQNLFRHALADVTARVELELTVETPLNHVVLEESGEQTKRRYLGLFGMELPLYLPFGLEGPYRVERENRPLTIFSLELPVALLQETYIFMAEVPVTYTEEQAKAQALVELGLMEKAYLENAEILERTAKGGLQDNSFLIQASYVCTMNIAEEKEILLAGSD